MNCFLVMRQPKSHQGSKGTKKTVYQDYIKKSFKKYHPKPIQYKQNLYGVVYYFFNKKVTADADNISKLIWDALKGELYIDDDLIKLSIAGIFDLKKSGISEFDITQIPINISTELFEAMNKEDHILYIEVGIFNTDFVKFNLEK